MPADVGCSFGALPRTPGFSRHGGHLGVAPEETGVWALSRDTRPQDLRERTHGKPAVDPGDPKACRGQRTDAARLGVRPGYPSAGCTPAEPASVSPGETMLRRPSFLGQLRNEGRSRREGEQRRRLRVGRHPLAGELELAREPGQGIDHREDGEPIPGRFRHFEGPLPEGLPDALPREALQGHFGDVAELGEMISSLGRMWELLEPETMANCVQFLRRESPTLP